MLSGSAWPATTGHSRRPGVSRGAVNINSGRSAEFELIDPGASGNPADGRSGTFAFVS
jgi:hypothetical protein